MEDRDPDRRGETRMLAEIKRDLEDLYVSRGGLPLATRHIAWLVAEVERLSGAGSMADTLHWLRGELCDILGITVGDDQYPWEKIVAQLRVRAEPPQGLPYPDIHIAVLLTPEDVRTLAYESTHGQLAQATEWLREKLALSGAGSPPGEGQRIEHDCPVCGAHLLTSRADPAQGERLTEEGELWGVNCGSLQASSLACGHWYLWLRCGTHGRGTANERGDVVPALPPRSFGRALPYTRR